MPRKLPKYLTPAELAALLEAARRSGPRDYALVCVMAYGGLRVAEAVALTWADVEPHIFVRRGKGDKQRYVPVHWRITEALSGLPSSEGRVFHLTTRGVQHMIVRLCAEAGIAREKAHPHTLRHTFATNVLRATGNILKVQRLLGHSSISTTQIYTHLVMDDLAEAVGLLE